MTHYDAKKTGQCVSKVAASKWAGQEQKAPAQDQSCEEENEEEESRAIMDLPLEDQEHEKQQDTAATLLQNIDEKVGKCRSILKIQS